MLTDQEMLEIAEHYLRKMSETISSELVIIPELTIKKPFGNIYEYDFKKFLETGDYQYVGVTPPFLVEKEKRRIVRFASSRTVEQEIEAYENGTKVPSLHTYWYPDTEEFSHK